MIKYLRSWWMKNIRGAGRAEAWTGSRADVRATRDSAQPIPVTEPPIGDSTGMTVTPDTLRDLASAGVVYAADQDGDLHRVTLFEMDRMTRERQAAKDPSRCPCSGRHFPSPAACRWCRCHDPKNLHHLPSGATVGQVIEGMVSDVLQSQRDLPPGIGKSESPVRSSDEIEKCRVCAHPQHGENGGRCSWYVPSGAASGGIELCRCNGTRILPYGSCVVCDHPGHVGMCGSWDPVPTGGVELCRCSNEIARGVHS